jgi:hypothetical protein
MAWAILEASRQADHDESSLRTGVAQVVRWHRSGGGDRLYVSPDDRPRVRTVHAEVSHCPGQAMRVRVQPGGSRLLA